MAESKTESKIEEKLTLRAAVMDAAEHWVSLNDLVARLDLKTKTAEGKARQLARELLDEGEIEAMRESDEASPIRRTRANMIACRVRALGLVTKDGATRATLRAEGITTKDVDELVRLGLVEEKDGERLSLSLKADEEIWSDGARAFVLRTLPAARAEDEGLAGRILVALAELAAWSTTEDVQEHLAKDGSERVALGVLETTLAEMFKANAVDLEGGEPKRWREGWGAATRRRAAILEHLLGASGRPVTTAELAGLLGTLLAVVEQDLVGLEEASFVESGEDGWRLAIEEEQDGFEALRFAARHSIDNFVESSTKEVKVWREKHGEEKRRANDLAQWLLQHGVEERDVLDQVRGVVRTPKARSDVFKFAQARPVNAEEKGIILGEIINLENEIAQQQEARDASISAYKGRIKALEAEIAALKNASTCSSRVVEVEAYRRTAWEEGKVYVHAVDDDRVLQVESLPKGAQRTIAGTEGKPAEDEKPASTEAIAKFAKEAAEKGLKVSTKEKANGQVGVVVEEGEPTKAAAAPADEPGPLASEEARREHAAKPKRKPKPQAREVGATS